MLNQAYGSGWGCLYNERDYKKRLLSEKIHIKCNKHSINKKEDIHTFNRIYFPLLSKF